MFFDDCRRKRRAVRMSVSITFRACFGMLIAKSLPGYLVLTNKQSNKQYLQLPLAWFTYNNSYWWLVTFFISTLRKNRFSSSSWKMRRNHPLRMPLRMGSPPIRSKSVTWLICAAWSRLSEDFGRDGCLDAIAIVKLIACLFVCFDMVWMSVRRVRCNGRYVATD